MGGAVDWRLEEAAGTRKSGRTRGCYETRQHSTEIKTIFLCQQKSDTMMLIIIDIMFDISYIEDVLDGGSKCRTGKKLLGARS